MSSYAVNGFLNYEELFTNTISSLINLTKLKDLIKVRFKDYS